MSKIEIKIPPMGESVTDATITRWLKKAGAYIKEDEVIVEIATDKVDNEITAPVSGVLTEILVGENQVAKVDQVIGYINTGEITEDIPFVKNETVENILPQIQTEEIVPLVDDKSVYQIPANTPNGKFLSPLVRSIVFQEELSLTEVEKITGSGVEGRITKDDLLKYLETRSVEAKNILQKTSEIKSEIQVTNLSGAKVEIIEMDRVRKLIAEHMVNSVRISPHVTSFVEADVTNLVNWRNKQKDILLKRENEKLTYTPCFVDAVVKALKDFPMVNISVDGNKILLKKYINIGMATALPTGNLIVPVIKNADSLSLLGLTKTVNDLANRARTNKLKSDEIQDGTFTITNFGTFGNISGTPIINQPEVAILGIGAIVKRPAVIETPLGDAIAIRHIMILSLAYDHRVVDGALGGQFLKRVADYLEQWDVNRTI